MQNDVPDVLGKGMNGRKKVMKNVMSKIGRTIVALLPVPACFLLQVTVIIVAEVFLMLPIMLESMTEGMSNEEMMLLVSQAVMSNIMILQIAAQAAMLLVFGLWYYFAYGRKKRPESAEKPDGSHIALLVALGLIFQFGIGSILSLIEIFAPQLMENYNELMELMGIGEMSLPVMIATSVMAPLSEEVLCRGVILRLAERVSARFWVVNFIQALAFGILHGNWVQGAYAFLLGLLLGYIYGKYRNIWLCMLLHGAMNLSSFVVAPFYTMFSEESLPVVYIVVLAVSAGLFAVCFKPFLKKKAS